MRCARCGFDSTDLWAVLPLVVSLLQREGRVTYRALKREFGCDEAFLADLREELVLAKQVAIDDEEGKVLVWVGASPVSGPTLPMPSPATGDQKTRIGNLPPLPQDSQLGTRHFSSRDADPQTRDPGRDAGERRQLTVMFCDLVGSTALSGQLDPEDLREVMRSYQEAVAEVIRPFDGYIARYLGDGLLIYFGYPWAHEDDAQRAVRAGLATAARMPYLNSRLRQTLGAQQVAPLQVRIGIHTGLVVVGEMGSEDYRDPTAIVGETPNIAARLQEITEPDTV